MLLCCLWQEIFSSEVFVFSGRCRFYHTTKHTVVCVPLLVRLACQRFFSASYTRSLTFSVMLNILLARRTIEHVGALFSFNLNDAVCVCVVCIDLPDPRGHSRVAHSQHRHAYIACIVVTACLLMCYVGGLCWRRRPHRRQTEQTDMRTYAASTTLFPGRHVRICLQGNFNQPIRTNMFFLAQQLFGKVFCCLCSFLCCSAFELCHQSQRIKSEQIKTFDIFLHFDFCFFVICNYICFCLISFIVVRMTLWPLSRIVMISPANGYCSELKCDLFNSSCYFSTEFIETENVCKN